MALALYPLALSFPKDEPGATKSGTIAFNYDQPDRSFAGTYTVEAYGESATSDITFGFSDVIVPQVTDVTISEDSPYDYELTFGTPRWIRSNEWHVDYTITVVDPTA